METYNDDLLKTYQEYEERNDPAHSAFTDFLFTHFAQYSSENAINNDKRSYNIYRATVSLTVAVFLSFAASLPFVLGSLAAQEITSDFAESASTASASASATVRP